MNRQRQEERGTAFPFQIEIPPQLGSDFGSPISLGSTTFGRPQGGNTQEYAQRFREPRNQYCLQMACVRSVDTMENSPGRKPSADSPFQLFAHELPSLRGGSPTCFSATAFMDHPSHHANLPIPQGLETNDMPLEQFSFSSGDQIHGINPYPYSQEEKSPRQVFFHAYHSPTIGIYNGSPMVSA